MSDLPLNQSGRRSGRTCAQIMTAPRKTFFVVIHKAIKADLKRNPALKDCWDRVTLVTVDDLMGNPIMFRGRFGRIILDHAVYECCGHIVEIIKQQARWNAIIQATELGYIDTRSYD